MNESNDYRSDQANKLKDLRSIGHKDLAEDHLEKIQQTQEYKEARAQKIQEHAKVFNLNNRVVPKEGKIYIGKFPEEEQIDFVSYVREKLAEFFEIQEVEGNRIKVILKDQMQFKKWPGVLNKIKNNILSVEFFDPGNIENDGIIAIVEPIIQVGEDNITLRFDKNGIDKEAYENVKNNKQTFGTSSILSISKNYAINMHPGMLHSVSLEI